MSRIKKEIIETIVISDSDDDNYQPIKVKKKPRVKTEPELNFELILYNKKPAIKQEKKREIKQEKSKQSEKPKMKNVNNSYTCSKCGKKIAKTFKNHDCSNKCKICHRVMASRFSLTNHVKSRRPKTMEIMTCDYCGKNYKIKHSLFKHMQLLHVNKGRQPFECDFDGKKFKDKSVFRNHMRAHLVPIKTCEICGSKVKNLQIHAATVHSKISPVCEICGKTLKNDLQLRLHVKIHSKPIKCAKCGRRYGNREKYREHLLGHENLRAFACHLCSLRFNARRFLTDHMKTHDKNRAKPHKCRLCGYSTPYRHHLGIHVARTHNGERPPKKFECIECGYCIEALSKIRNHMACHRRFDEKVQQMKDPRKCSMCYRHCDGKVALFLHVQKMHLLEKKFECDLCGRLFRTKMEVRRHIFAVHLKMNRKKIRFSDFY
jgi:KRAB domain-containing zinc finger protein